MTLTTPQQRRAGLVVHVLTASGAIAGFVALQAAYNTNTRAALVWLVVCQVLDGIDGPIARKVDVTTHAPHIDGHILDLVVDYVTCVMVPVVLILKEELVPTPWRMVVAGGVCLSSALWFARTDQETEDDWFNGFPAGWNIVVPTIMILGNSQPAAMIVIGILAATQFTNVKFPHIVKARALRPVTYAITTLYFSCFVYLSVRYPNGPNWARAALVVLPIYLAFIVTWRTFFPHRKFFGVAIYQPRPAS